MKMEEQKGRADLHPNRESPKDDENGVGENHVVGKNPFRKAIDICEQMVLFSILYIHSSPLQPLIGPGSANSDDFVLVHACYYAILLFVPLAYVLANCPGIRTYLSKDANLCVFVENKEKCVDIVSDLFTNRFSFAVASLFIVMSLITMRVFATNEYTRPSLHNGFWILKLMFIFIVSLIAFSIPPTLFDLLWGLICAFGSLIQTLFITFLLLDWTNVTNRRLNKEEKPSSEKESKFNVHRTLACLCVLTLLALSITGFIYVTYWFFKKRGVSPLNVIQLIIQLKFAVIISSLARPDCTSMPQCTIMLGCFLFRLGLTLSYETPQTGVFTLYMLGDTVFKLATVAYGLFRCLQQNQYTFQGSTIYGRSNPESLSVYDNNTVTSCYTKNEEINKNPEPTGELEKSPGSEENSSSDEKMTKDTVDYDETKCNEKMLKTRKGKCCSTSTEVSSYSFFHFFLLTTCLDTNANLTSYKIIAENDNKFVLHTGDFSAFTLHMSSIMIAVVFTWSKIAKRFHVDIDEYSMTSLMKAFAKSAVDIFTRVMIKPPLKTIRIKYLYMGLLAIHLLLSVSVLFPSVKRLLESSPLFCPQKTKQGRCLSTDPSLVALYQVSFTFAGFFLAMLILLAGVTTLANPRNTIQLGFWPSKILFLGLLFAYSFYLPTAIGNIWTHMGLVATLMVTLLQCVVVLDLTTQILDHIRVKEARTIAPRRIHFSCSSIAVLLYTLAITAFFCFYVYFAQFSSCKSNRIFICINLGLCILASAISLHPAVQAGGLVQSAIMTSFCMYCTWTALYNNPREECNPMTQAIFESDIKPTKALLFTIDIAAFVATTIYVTVYITRIETFIKQFAFICFQLKCLRRSVSNLNRENDAIPLSKLSYQDALFGKQRESFLKRRDEASEGDSRRNCVNSFSYENEAEGTLKEDIERGCESASQADNTLYNYSLFHVTYAFLIMHLFTLMITWTDERPGSHIIVSFHWAMMCIKMVASSASVILYTWSLVVHLFWNNSCRNL